MAEWLIAVICVGLLGAFVVCTWRWTSVVTRLAESSARFEERNALQRDRMMTTWVEKHQVSNDPEQAFRMANLHAGETKQARQDHLHRDQAADKELRNRKRDKKRIVDSITGPAYAPGAEKDAMR